jgi:hypothetical protein
MQETRWISRADVAVAAFAAVYALWVCVLVPYFEPPASSGFALSLISIFASLAVLAIAILALAWFIFKNRWLTCALLAGLMSLVLFLQQDHLPELSGW